MSLNSNIVLFKEERYKNTKASEEYVHVKFKYPDIKKEWEGWVPVEYRRTGVSIPVSAKTELEEHLNSIYEQMHPSKYKAWVTEQDQYWNATRSVETKEIFNTLKDGKWHCRNCDISNPNFARRIQDIKEMGYTVATHVNYHCPVCGNNRSTRLLLLPINRVKLAGNGLKHGLLLLEQELFVCWVVLMCMKIHPAEVVSRIINFLKFAGMMEQSPRILKL